jgi:myo-inositol-1(or 4)-monophosphatase
MDIERISRLLMRVADEELMPRFTRVVGRLKADGSLITEADTAVQERMVSELRAVSPDVLLLGEEMATARQRQVLQAGQDFWCLDPLDGTTNFATGLPYFAISLALVRNGEAAAAWVYDPTRAEIFVAERGQGARLNGTGLEIRTAPDELRECVALVDTKRLEPALAYRLATQSPYRSQRSLGAVALDWCWLAAGRVHVYLHGRQNIWDHAAGALVAAEAGALICLADRADGRCDSRLILGSRTGIGAASPSLFAQWRRYLGEP